MGYIYCITNLINNKKYIGKTVLDVETRFKEHCKDSQRKNIKNRPLYSAFNKYGIENFRVDTIEEVKDETKLSDREIYWINEIGTYGHLGYNATKGGDGKLLYDYNEIIELYNLGYTIKQVSEKLNCDAGNVSRILKSHNIYIRGGSGKMIDQYDKAGNYIQTFYNSFEAAQWCVDFGKSKTKHSASNHIINCCNGKQNSTCGYKWKYKEPL